MASATPFYIVLNASSGREPAERTHEIITRVLGEAGREHRILVIERGQQVGAVAKEAVALAHGCSGTVVAAGGDGTINAVAQATIEGGCTFGVLPQGTFNYFSRVHGIPYDTEAATRLLLSAEPQAVQVGLMNDRVFLVNASLGLYPKLLEDREAFKQQYGRTRLVALGAALVTLMQAHRPLRLVLEHGGSKRAVRTPTLFVGNNPLQFAQIGVPHGDSVGAGRLAAITLRPIGTLGMLWLIARGAFGTLGEADDVSSFPVDSLTVRPSRKVVSGWRRGYRFKVAIDGEVGWLEAPIVFRVSPKPLQLLKPPGLDGRAVAAEPPQ